MTIRGILFDKDGTLLDYYATWMPLNRIIALEVAGGDQTVADDLLIVGGYDPATGKIGAGSLLAAGNNAEIAAAWHTHLGDCTSSLEALVDLINTSFESGGGAYATAVTDLPVLLKRLKSRGLKLGVATADSERGAHETLGPFGVIDLFDFVAGYDSGHGTKPGPGLVNGFMAATGLMEHEVMVVGDNLHDLHMGRSANAGCVIGVLTGTSDRQHLTPHADYVLGDITEIETVLDGLT